MAGLGGFDKDIRNAVFQRLEGGISTEVSWKVERDSVQLMVS
jgi:hypothetical protein